MTSKTEFKQYDDVFFNGVRSKIVSVNPISKTFNVRTSNSLAQNIEGKDLFASFEEWQAAHGNDPLVKPVDLLAWHKPPVAPRPEAPARKLAITPQPVAKVVQGDQFIAPMSKIEAQTLVNQIRSGFNVIGEKLLQLKERDGWKALGYASWRECVTKEFDFSQSHVYRLLEFADVERNISPIGEKLAEPLKESQARELKAAPPEQQASILEKAIETVPEGGKLTAQHIKRTVETETTKTEIKIDYVDPETGDILSQEIPTVEPAMPQPEVDPVMDLLHGFPHECLNLLQGLLECAAERKMTLAQLASLVGGIQ